MSQVIVTRPCPCGSGQLLFSCCGAYLDGRSNPPTAEALMRSRYTAFVIGNAEYLMRTWDPAHRPPTIELEGNRTEWLGLEVLRKELGGENDSSGRVEFIARFRLHGKEEALRENSLFRKLDGRWLYIDGETEQTGASDKNFAPIGKPSVARNAPCPCGSGQKYKRCCGKF